MSDRFNINLYDTSQSKGNNKTEDYLVHMNTELTNKITEISQEIITLENKLETSEDLNDSLEQKIVYLRGLLKNIFAIKNMEMSLSKNYQLEIKETNKSVDNFNKSFRNIIISFFVNFLIFCFALNNFEAFFVLLLNSILVFGFSKFMSHNDFHNIVSQFLGQNKINLKKPSLSGLRKEIDDLEKNNDYINEFIDCI